MPAKLQPASFAGIKFPTHRYSVKGSLRYHVHEYPHAFGGAFENLQRKLYEVRMSCTFYGNLRSYPNLWPQNWRSLVVLFEQGAVSDLEIPTIGKMKARCTVWPEEFDVRKQPGITAELEFIEDQNQLFLAHQLVVAAKANVNNATVAFIDQTKQLTVVPDIFDSIQEVANDIFALKDQAELYSGLLEAKILRLDSLVHEADSTVVMLQDPGNWQVLNSLRALWASAMELKDDILSQGRSLKEWTVPKLMGVGEISTAIYGDTSHATELLQINPFEDALSIPAGTVVKYYPQAA